MRILLVYLRSPKHYSIWNPLSIEALIGHLRGALKGIEVDGLDLVSKNDMQYLFDIYIKYDVIGFSISSYTLDAYKDIIANMVLREKVVILGNQLPTYLPHDIFNVTLEYSDVLSNNVFISIGEGELCLCTLVEKFLHNETDYSNIPNLAFEKEGKFVITEKKTVDLAQLIYPPHYINEKNEVDVIQMQLSRGCYWGNCSFCTRLSFRGGRRWSSFPMKRIKEDLFHAIINLGVKSIEFCDDEFFGGRTKDKLERVKEIGSYIKELASSRDAEVKFRIFTRPDFIYMYARDVENNEVKETIKFLKSCGLSRIYMGLESGCDSQLKRYNRGVNDEVCRNAIKTLINIDMNYDSGFILFDPGLKLNEICENIDFYRRNNLIETNQWFWRPMVANVGSKIGDELISHGKKYDLDSMSVEYEYDDELIKHIYNVIDFMSKQTKEIFYALKSISKKDYDYSDSTKYNYHAHEYVKENGMIYVDLLDNLAKSFMETRERVNSLVDRVLRSCEEGIFDEQDKEELLKKINAYYKEWR